ncbi:exodeoxyribonuclease V subunit beta [Pseudoalteromonas sp. SSDWG2]|uniref:exodeoxyribonuclease V subunit beta n=1 Tax=Pseudoalteromonas sp. SSDWG2 TaxID=3139391 RepID=UPI003BA91B82
MQILDPLTLPLAGQQLIEASAGTGKTYTITGLYLRYLLGLYQGANGEQGEPLSVEQILVVTFTEAATSEIKDRVRARITIAKDTLLGKHTEDELVNSLLAQVAEPQQAFNLLDVAAKSLDESAIYTIHGFCQRMLKQHAFESNMAFNLQFILDERELYEQAVFDFWRQFVYGLSAQQAQAVLAHYSSPFSLLKLLSPLISKEQLIIEPQVQDPNAQLLNLWQQQQAYLDALPQFKQALLDGDFFAQLDASDIKGTAKPKHKANVSGLQAFCQSDAVMLELGKAGHSYSLWSSHSLSDAAIYKKNGTVFEHAMVPQFEHMARLSESFGAHFAHVILHLALASVRRHIERNKKRQALISPDDLLRGLYCALKDDQQGVLCAQIRSQYPVAMIDEFQDTDPIQYGIFNTLYTPKEGQFSGLTMIGDPKQAIYGFRGADIFTYIDAKHQLGNEQLYTLGKNYRSSSELVQCVNDLFASHPNSFIFNKEIPFIEVAAQGKAKQLCLDDAPLPAMELQWFGDDNEVLSKDLGHQGLASAYAKRIHYLLAMAQQGRLTLAEQPPSAGDFCVLVRDRNEAALMKKALGEVGVASVYLARDSVFKQPIAAHLYRLLCVLHGPYDERLLRGMLRGPFYNYSAQRILALSDDQHAWQALLNDFAQLRKLWYSEGALAMLEHVLWNNALPTLWRNSGWDVERALTDYRHLCEILQHKQLELDGTARLLNYFHQQLAAQSSDSDSAQLRLETDANLVQIVTMHASKGLEYPIVFMPFALSFRPSSLAYYHDKSQFYLDLAQSEQSMERAEQERLAEDLRLLYVALTRGIYHVSLGLYSVGQRNRSAMNDCALGYLLFGADQHCEASNFFSRLQQRFAANQGVRVCLSEQTPCSEGVLLGIERAHAEVAQQQATIERNWRATSFSALSYKHHDSSAMNLSGADDEDHRIEQYLNVANDTRSEQLTAYDFPKGPGPGSCLHDILEQISFSGVAQQDAQAMAHLSDVIEASLEKYALDEKWQPLLEQWMVDIVRCPLSESGLSLGALDSKDCLVEMEFHVPIEQLDAPTFNNAMLRIFSHDFALDFERVKGVLKGFIDLIFCYQGRYYVLDYKSNYLGDSATDYNFDALTHAMNSHSYHVQGAIYMVALHRLLKARMPNYNPQQHLGSMVYTFLRAMGEGQGVYHRTFSADEIIALDGLFAQGARGDD